MFYIGFILSLPSECILCSERMHAHSLAEPRFIGRQISRIRTYAHAGVYIYCLCINWSFNGRCIETDHEFGSENYTTI